MRKPYSESSANQPLILLVEPMADLRSRIAEAMKRTNVRLLAAENGKAALEIVHRVEWPTLAIIELSLADMRGSDLARTLYRHRPLPIIMTGYQAEPLTVTLLLDQLAEDFIHKPFDERELIVRMLRLLPRKTPHGVVQEQPMFPHQSLMNHA